VWSLLAVFLMLAFWFGAPAAAGLYALSLHDALPISIRRWSRDSARTRSPPSPAWTGWGSPTCSPPNHTRTAPSTTTRSTTRSRRSEEHTSELQSRFDLVCRLLLEKKNRQRHTRRARA